MFAAQTIGNLLISIHAPREGSDLHHLAGIGQIGIFLSTLPVRGATNMLLNIYAIKDISIHAPREGSDLVLCSFFLLVRHFYPRSP